MTTSMNATLTAIGRQLQAEYSPIVATPLPGEIENLLARLVAREAGTQGPIARSEAVQSAIAQPRPRS